MDDKFTDSVELNISDIAYEGKGVGKIDRYVYFVPKTAVGDVICAGVTKRSKNYSQAEIIKIISPSTDRIEPKCPYFDRCGGCHYMHLDYDRQLAIKREHLVKNLEKIGKIANPPVGPTIPSMLEHRYRNKSVFHVGLENEIGYMAQDSQEILDIDYCLICDETINRALASIRKFLKSSEAGRIKNISLRIAKNPQSMTIILGVIRTDPKMAREFTDSLKNLAGKLSVFESVKPSDSTMIFSQRHSLITGEEKALEKIGDFVFELSPFSFFQINLEQTARLIETTAQAVGEDISEKTILDLYCGVGLFSIPLAKKAKSVLGIDSSLSSIEDAKKNALLNSAANTKFISARAREITKGLLREDQRFDLIVLDPPRQGADKDLLKNISGLGAKKIIYISCSPPTLSRDIKLLYDMGFSLKKTIPIDMFPQTYHIESVSILEKAD